MSTDKFFEFEGREFQPKRVPKLTPAEQREADERFHDEPSPPRCMSCWNLEPCCTCKNSELLAFEAQQRAKEREHPSNPNWRARLDRMAGGDYERVFAEYIERGTEELERLVNQSPE